MTVLNAPMSMATRSPQTGLPADDFVDRLSHARAGNASNAVSALFQSLFTFGLLPLVIWPTRWAAFVDSERTDLLQLASWWRQQVSPQDATQLDAIVSRLRPRPILIVLPWLAAGFNGLLMFWLWQQGDTLSRIWDLTFHFNRHWTTSLPLEQHLHPAWIAGLCFGYSCQWYAVRSHAATVHALIQWTNQLGKTNKFARIKNETLKLGLHPLWIGAAIVLCNLHAWWSIPMVFAGALQRRYITKSSSAIRIALASQARDAFAANRFQGARFCQMETCGCRVPDAASFCPRCGTPIAG